MVDQQSQQQAVGILSTVIAELMEDVDPFAVLRAATDGDDPGHKLKQLGKDIVTLAAAIIVLRRIGSDG